MWIVRYEFNGEPRETGFLDQLPFSVKSTRLVGGLHPVTEIIEVDLETVETRGSA